MSDDQNQNPTTTAPTSTGSANPAPDSTKPRAEKTLAVRLLRGYFPDSGVKLKPGEVHELPMSVAKKLVNSRKAELPDDEA